MLSLQPFGRADFDRFIAWVADEETLMQFAGPSLQFPLTADQLELSLPGKDRLVYKIVHTDEQAVIGHAEIHLQDAGTALLRRIFIGNTAYRGKGLGTYAVKELLTIAFRQAGVEEVFLNVFDWNLPAIKSYENAGFHVNAGKTLTRHIKDKTWTAINMRINRKTWDQQQKIPGPLPL